VGVAKLGHPDPENDDVYAIGGTRIMALGMPVDKIPAEMVRRVLEDATLVDACRLAPCG